MLRSRVLAAGLVAACLLPMAPAAAEARDNLPSFLDQSYVLGTFPSGDEGAAGATLNPAQWGMLERTAFDFWWSDLDVRPNAWDNWGFAVGKNLGFNYQRTDFLHVEPDASISARRVFDHQIGLAKGSGKESAGMAFGWSGGDAELLGRKSFLSFGAISRPSPALSYGLVYRTAFGETDRRFLVDLGLRPLGSGFVTVFGDYAVRTGQKWTEGDLEAGLSLRPLSGLDATFKLQPAGSYQFALGVTVGRFGVAALPRYDTDGHHQETHYLARVNPSTPGFDVDGELNDGRRMLEVDLNGRLAYQKYRWGDEGTLPLLGVIEELEFARRDPTVGGVVLNLSGLSGNPEMVWEVRVKLEQLRSSGKNVVAYVDRVGLSELYLASVADRIVMHPEGSALLPGIPSYRTYLKNMLAKIGVGFEEWRHFKYKSASESFSREDMSEADREQRLELIQAFYDEMAGTIAAARGLTRAAVDDVVNRTPLFFPEQLVEAGLVDAVGTWDERRAVCQELAGGKLSLWKHQALAERRDQPREDWGPDPKIAVVYAVGGTSMDEGIRARASAKTLDRLRRDREVDAVVIRADSPGGDPLAADVFAHETRRLRKAMKPTLVSQGRVAASGGYWISMDAMRIYTSPFTITGSIGVIGGWAWNDGLGEKLGLTSDHVQVGEHADLFGGLTLPLLGATIPERNLTTEEREMAKDAIFHVYDRFVEGVAEARDLSEERVREIGEGRVYAGRRARELGLVDEVGSLDQTIAEAKRVAGIGDEVEVEIVEYPKPPLFRWPSFVPDVPGLLAGLGLRAAPESAPPASATYSEMALRQMLASPGRPLLLTPVDLLPEEPLEALPER